MKTLLLDTNIVLDVILERRPNAAAAARLWSALERKEGRGIIPAHGVTTIFYLLAKARGAPFAHQGIERLMSIFGVAAVDDAVLRRALALAWPDFEDAVCAAAAEGSGCNAIVTRDPAGFPDASLPVLDAASAHAWLLLS